MTEKAPTRRNKYGWPTTGRQKPAGPGLQRAFSILWALFTFAISLVGFSLVLILGAWVARGCDSGLSCDGQGFSGPVEVVQKSGEMLLLVLPLAAGAALLFAAALESFRFAWKLEPDSGRQMWRFTGLALACAAIPLAAFVVLLIIVGAVALVQLLLPG